MSNFISNFRSKRFKASIIIVIIMNSFLMLSLPVLQKTFAEELIKNDYEEKIFYNAQISDDFADDSIIVIT